MTSAIQLALDVLPHFRTAVLKRHVYTYGHYASAIGRDSATESMVVGKAMHAIGAACVLGAVPLAPLHFVERADGEWRGVFEADASESIHVLPEYNLLYVTARDHHYSERDFERIHRALAVAFPKHLKPDQLSPHDLWHIVIHAKLKDGSTILQQALIKYRELAAQQRANRGA